MDGQSAIPIHSLTLKFNGITNVIHTPIKIFVPGVFNNSHETRGIWDTGASNTVITQEVVDKLNLKSTGITYVNTASERNKRSETFTINIGLKDDLIIQGVNATVGVLVDGIDCLIGMDIICMGDFSITNHKENTCMSFRIPSLHELDYVKNKVVYNPATDIFGKIASSKTGRNDPCPCGSGKKYKNCHGK
jgi:predicted aspartyl protease